MSKQNVAQRKRARKKTERLRKNGRGRDKER